MDAVREPELRSRHSLRRRRDRAAQRLEQRWNPRMAAVLTYRDFELISVELASIAAVDPGDGLGPGDMF